MDSTYMELNCTNQLKYVSWKAKSPLAKEHWFIGDCMVSFKVVSPFAKKRGRMSQEYFLESLKYIQMISKEKKNQVHYEKH